jgi:hypothetical protein
MKPISTEIRIIKYIDNVIILDAVEQYGNGESVSRNIGRIHYKDKEELNTIIEKLEEELDKIW